MLKNNKSLKLTILACCTSILVSCSTMVERDISREQIKKELGERSDGHITNIPANVISNKPIKPILPKINVEELLSSKTILDKKFTLNVIRTPVQNILFSLAKDAGIQLDIQGLPNKRVTLVLNQVPLRFILERLAQQAGFVYEYRNGILTVKPDVPVWRDYKIDYVNISSESSGSIELNTSIGTVAGEPTDTSQGRNNSQIKYKTKQEFWKTLEENLVNFLEKKDLSNKKNDSSSGKIIVNKETGVVSVYANSRVHADVARFISKIVNRSKRQVLIEATVVEVQLDEKFKTGIDWSTFKLSNSGLNTQYPFYVFGNAVVDRGIQTVVNKTFAFNYGIDFLRKFGKAKILSTPKIMCINNQTSILKVVDNEVYFTVQVNKTSNSNTTDTTYQTTVHTVPVGFMMSMTPFVGDNGDITLHVRPTLSRIIGYKKDPNPSLDKISSEIPIIQEREISSTLRLRDGQIAVLGGLMQSYKNGNNTSLPGVGDIAGIGELFNHYDNNKKKTELVIFIRPHIINKPSINNDLSMFKKQLNY